MFQQAPATDYYETFVHQSLRSASRPPQVGEIDSSSTHKSNDRQVSAFAKQWNLL